MFSVVIRANIIVILEYYFVYLLFYNTLSKFVNPIFSE